MLVKLWHQSLPIFFDRPSRFVAVLVIFKSVLHGNAGHSNVNTRFEGVTIWVKSENRRMFGDFILQQNHVNAVVESWFLRWSSRSPFQHQLNPMLMMSCPDHSSVLAAIAYEDRRRTRGSVKNA